MSFTNSHARGIRVPPILVKQNDSCSRGSRIIEGEIKRALFCNIYTIVTNAKTAILPPFSKYYNAAQRKTCAAQKQSLFRSTAHHSIRSWGQEKVLLFLSPCTDLYNAGAPFTRTVPRTLSLFCVVFTCVCLFLRRIHRPTSLFRLFV